MVEVKCDRWTCKYFQNNFCNAIEVTLETQGDNDLCCLTFENYDPKVAIMNSKPRYHFFKGEM